MHSNVSESGSCTSQKTQKVEIRSKKHNRVAIHSKTQESGSETFKTIR